MKPWGIAAAAFAAIALVELMRPEDLYGISVETKNAGVDLEHLHPELEARLQQIGRTTRRVLGRNAIITSGNDGDHKASSKHYVGVDGYSHAIDLRTNDVTAAKAREYVIALDNDLNGSGHVIDVIIHPTGPSRHAHLELDRKSYRAGVMLPDGKRYS